MSAGLGSAQRAKPSPAGVALWAPLLTLWVVWGTTYIGTSAMVQSIPPLLGAGSRYFVGALPLAVIVVVAVVAIIWVIAEIACSPSPSVNLSAMM